MKWAVLVATILLAALLMAPLAKKRVVEANPRPFECSTIQIDSPNHYPTDIYQETTIPLEVRVSPFPTGIEFVDMYYSLDDGPNISLSIFTLEDSTAFFGEGTLDNLTDGNHTVKAYSTDNQGNTISTSTTFLVNTTIRFSPFLLSPTNTTYTSKEIPLTYTIDDSKYVVYISMDKYAYYKIDGNTTLPELSEAQHTITAIAYDLNGEVYSKQKATFTIDTTSPTSTPFDEPQLGQEIFLGVAVIVAVIIIGLCLLVYLIKKQ